MSECRLFWVGETLFWVGGDGWGIFWGWVWVGGALIWVNGAGWVGLGGDEWGWVHCLIMPKKETYEIPSRKPNPLGKNNLRNTVDQYRRMSHNILRIAIS